MSNTQYERTPGSGASGGDWWSRRPRRSANDRKIAGVAGGLGRAFGVDPVLFRVGFAILLFTGFGLLLYVLGWLLLPADGDEVSAGESLLGRGQSSTPPALAVGLAIVAGMSILGIFSWGLPVAPLVIGGIIAVLVLRKKGRSGGCAKGRSPRAGALGDAGYDDAGFNGAGYPGAGQQPWADDWAAKMGQKAESWGAQAEQWVARQPWSGGPGTSKKPGQSDPASPFDQPAFWDEDSSSNATRPAAANQPRINLSKDAPAAPAEPAEPTPPAWDPLGVAPFAWDLPEPTPLPVAPTRQSRSVVGRVTMGAVLLVGGLATVGIIAGWWHMTWAAVSATALAVLAIGLLIGSLRGRGHSLIGPGIFLSAVTLALAVTGISGTAGYGQQTWSPTTVDGVQAEYVLNGGQGTLDLRNLTVPPGDTVNTQVEVRAGQASVIVPADANVNVTCTTNAGEVDCLGTVAEGLQQEASRTQQGSSDTGTINLDVHVGAGQAEVRNG